MIVVWCFTATDRLSESKRVGGREIDGVSIFKDVRQIGDKL
jgi:hypothetical protein